MRRTWHVDHLDIVDEPMALSLIKYRHYEDRKLSDHANVVSSNLTEGGHMPIVDLDFPHHYVEQPDSESSASLEVYAVLPSNWVGLQVHRFRVWFLHVVWNWLLH